MFRSVGLSLVEVKEILSGESNPSISILEKRLSDLEKEILGLRTQQHLITSMLKGMTSRDFTPIIDKRVWVEMLKSAGLDERGMKAWHSEFESRSPAAHYDFLLSLGITDIEAREIQEWSRSNS